MGIARRLLARGTVGLGLTVTAAVGCQTYPAGFGGMTLPSPHYLKHYPQYFPPDDRFPLQRELDSMQDPDALLRQAPGAGAVAPLPAPAIPVAPAPAATPQNLPQPAPGVAPVAPGM